MRKTDKSLKTGRDYVRRLRQLETIKTPWLVHFQALAEVFLTRKMDFTRMMTPGQFLQADLFDNTGQFSAYLCANILYSMLWPGARRAFRVRPTRRLRKIPGMEEYFRWATGVCHEYMERPEAGQDVAIIEYLLDEVIFATAGINTEDNSKNDPELPLLYSSWGVKNMNIAETAQGQVDQIYYIRPIKLRQLIQEYSRPGDTIPAKIIEMAKDPKNLDEDIDVLHVIEPKDPELNISRSAPKHGTAGMKIRTVHVAVEHEARLRVGGYEEMPVAVGRFWKQANEPYGRSPAMIALPDAQSLNTLTEAILVASEKSLDPPLGVLDDGRLGGGVVDTSAGAISVFNIAGRQTTEKPIFALQTVGELQKAHEQAKELMAKIAQAFMLDRLLDFNNQTQMTAFETSVRDKIRGESAGGVFTRQEREGFTPMVERSFNILFRGGYLGIIDDGPGAGLRHKWDAVAGADKVIVPKALVEAHRAGLNVFEVEYISPASRFRMADELRGLLTATDAAIALAAVQPQVLDGQDPDVWLRRVYERAGAPIEVVRTEDALKQFRAANRQAADEEKQIDQGEKKANIALKAAQARSQLGTAPPATNGVSPAAGAGR